MERGSVRSYQLKRRCGLQWVYFTRYITSFTALTVRSTLGSATSIRVGVKGRGVSEAFTRITG